ALRHRLRKDPLESIDSGYKVQKVFSQVFGLAEPEAAVQNGMGKPAGVR
ncbi:magnesium chelatase ATPase subunit I, partial [filamentous cyanobacterium CCP1]